MTSPRPLVPVETVAATTRQRAAAQIQTNAHPRAMKDWMLVEARRGRWLQQPGAPRSQITEPGSIVKAERVELQCL